MNFDAIAKRFNMRKTEHITVSCVDNFKIGDEVEIESTGKKYDVVGINRETNCLSIQEID